MSRVIDLTGKRFGRITVLYRSGSKKHYAQWHCRCDCGIEKNIRSDKLISGRTQSCGCLHEENKALFSTKTHGETGTRLYKIWAGMITRCENPNLEKFKRDYQDRGISVCQDWHDYIVFRDWALTNGYAENLTIDRIDNNNGYSPDNCRWATAKVQGNNKRNNRNFTFNNETKTVSQWADATGIKYSTLYYRLIIKGWNVERAVSQWGSYENAGQKS